MSPSARIIAVANHKGGVGKTTTTVNLAASLAVLERKVLVIDLDPQGAVARCLGIKRSQINGGMYDVVVRGVDIRDQVMKVGRVELGLVPANVRSDEEVNAYMLAISRELLSRSLEQLRADFDYILLDNPTIGPITSAALAATDSLLIPVQCEELAVRTVGGLLSMARKINAEQNPRLRLEGMVLTMADARTSLTAQVIATMRKSFGPYLLRTIVPRSVDLARATANGEPLVFTRAGARGAQAYLRLGTEIIKREQC